MKRLFRKILCPIAFDENSIAALEIAGGLAWEPDSVLCLLHVVPPPVLIPEAGIPLEPYPLMTEHEARAKLTEFAKQKLGDKVHYEIFVRTGDPARMILQAVEELEVDSVVMATHGRKGVSRFFLGSVAERIVRESPRPVLTMRVPSAGS